MAEFTIKPTKRFESLVAVLGGVNRASQAWGVQYVSLRRFLNGTHGVAGDTIATVLERTGMDYKELFVNHRKET